MSDSAVLVLLFYAVFVLAKTKALIVPAFTDPPDPRRADGSLRPPLRGPPLFSVA